MGGRSGLGSDDENWEGGVSCDKACWVGNECYCRFGVYACHDRPGNTGHIKMVP